MNEAVREIKFISHLLEIMNIQVMRPAKVLVDNIGCIFLAKNKSTSDRTKHIDMKYHYIREQIKNGSVALEFVRTAENHADILTKNLGGEKFKYHAEKVMKGVD